jgi:hypothetical protein
MGAQRRSIVSWMTSVVFAAAMLVPWVGRGESDAQEDPVRKKRFEFLQQRVDQFEISFADDDRRLSRGSQTILRWNNPVREFMNDGVTYLFLDGQRPHAVVTLWARSPEASLETGEIWREFVSISGPALTCRRSENVLWTPVTRSDVSQAVAGTAAPASKPPQRLAQLRELARRFSATNFKMEEPNVLRLLSQPLYRYQDEAAGILDGALFAFVEGNDPEALLLLEAGSRDGKKPEWRYTVARMTSLRVQIKLDDHSILDVPPYWKGPRRMDDLYMEARDGTFSLPK